jgi:hypothetical protein
MRHFQLAAGPDILSGEQTSINADCLAFLITA